MALSIGAGAFGTSLAFSVARNSNMAAHERQALRGGSSPNESGGGMAAAAIAATGIFIAASAVHAEKRASRRKGRVPLHAVAVAEELLFQPGERVTLLGPPAMAGKQGVVVEPGLDDSFAIRFDSGSVFNIECSNIQSGGSSAAASYAAPAAAAAAVVAPPASGGDEELEFQPGQRVAVLGPPAMAGKQGTIVGPALGDAFSVRFDSGSVFNIMTANLQEAAGSAAFTAAASASTAAAEPAASGDEDELEFQTGQRVVILGPPAMAGKQGSIVKPALGDAFAVLFDSGSVFNIATVNIQDAAEPSTAAAASCAAPAAAAGDDDDELLFQPGEKVCLVGPPAMAGKQGTVVGPALGDAFAVRFVSGSVFNIETHNIQGSGVSAPASTPAVTTSHSAPAAVAATGARDEDDELEFQAGQQVIILGPPAMAGKQATVEGPALGNSFAVRFASGSVFNIATENLQDAGGLGFSPSSVSAPAVAAAPVASQPTSQGDEDVEFLPGQRVEVLAPPAMAGKQGTVVGPALGDAFAVRFDTGSVFHICTANLRMLAVA